MATEDSIAKSDFATSLYGPFHGEQSAAFDLRPPLAVKWTYRRKSGSTPAVAAAGDHLYVGWTGREPRVLCIDGHSGRLVWETKVPHQVSRISIGGDVVVVTQFRDYPHDDRVDVIDRQSGTRLQNDFGDSGLLDLMTVVGNEGLMRSGVDYWMNLTVHGDRRLRKAAVRTDGMVVAPGAGGGHLISQNREIQLVDLISGEVQWGLDFVAGAAVVLARQDPYALIHSGYSDGEKMGYGMLDLRKQELLWGPDGRDRNYPDLQPSRFLSREHGIVAVQAGGEFVGLDIATGACRWSVPYKDPDNRWYRFRAIRTGDVFWHMDFGVGELGPDEQPLRDPGDAYLVCRDISSGELLWKELIRKAYRISSFGRRYLEWGPRPEVPVMWAPVAGGLVLSTGNKLICYGPSR